jgi:mono/diheme cytochrome c family protein
MWAGGRAVLLLIIVAAALTGAPAHAQENLDQGMSGPKLFAATCADCHKSARGLAKGRLSFTLSYFLRQHYTSSSATAQTLTAYLQSIDTPPAKTQPRPAQKNASAPATRPATTSASSLRPPSSIPAR